MTTAMIAWCPTAQELHEAHPDLTLAQIHAALAYYYDHKAELDAQSERDTKEFDEARNAAKDTPGQARLGKCVEDLELIALVYEPEEIAN